MKNHSPFVHRLAPLLNTLTFIKRNWAILFALGLIAGTGRVVQLGGFGEVSRTGHIVLEVLIEGSRLGILLFALGAASAGKGFLYVRLLFSGKLAVRHHMRQAWKKMKSRWMDIAVSFIAFACMAGAINLLIDQLAYETCLYLTLKRHGVLSDTSSEWTILLFFKNISVIPFTLVFEILLLRWLVNKWPSAPQPSEV